MPPENSLVLPFVNRDMLRFKDGALIQLRLDMQSDTAADLAVEGMTRENTFQYKTTTLADSTISQATFGLSDIPIYITVRDVARTLVQGNTFITISLLINGVVVQQLTSGYVYKQKSLSWPNTQQTDLRPGGGLWTTLAIPEPAAGAIAEIVVPANEIWLVRSVTFVLVTSATVGDRTPYLEFTDNAGGFFQAISLQVQIASKTFSWTAAPFGADTNASVLTDIQFNMPNNILIDGPTGMMDLKVGGLKVDDNINFPTITIEKFYK